MSCTMSRESRIMLAELLANEKEDTRRWLRAEMNGLVDPIIDSLFQRLTNKLMVNVGWDREGTDGECAQVVNPSDHVDPPNPQPSTSKSLDPTSSQLIIQQQHDPNVVHYSYQPSNDSLPMTIENEPMHCNEINDNQQCESQSLVQQQQQQQSSLMSPNVQVNFDLPLNELANEQSNNDGEDEEEEGECFCEECLAAIEIEDEQGIVDDDDQEGEQTSAPPVKRPRMENSTQPNNSQQQQPEKVRLSSTDEAQQQPNQANKHYITVHLQCPLSNCPATFPEDQLAQHLFDAHSIGPFRCLVKDCAQSFDDSAFLKQHRLQSHQSITEWHCDACDKHYPSYDRLSLHCQQHHQLGLFRCSFSACTFTGEYRQKVSTHYSKQHRRPTKCCHCHYATADPSNLKRHERGHLGIKPYRCKLSHCSVTCDYASASQSDTLKHIRTHLARYPIGSVPNGIADPKDFLEIRTH